jgi:hypothetical protein
MSELTENKSFPPSRILSVDDTVVSGVHQNVADVLAAKKKWDYHKQLSFQCGLLPHHFHSLLRNHQCLRAPWHSEKCAVNFLIGGGYGAKLCVLRKNSQRLKETPYFIKETFWMRKIILSSINCCISTVALSVGVGALPLMLIPLICWLPWFLAEQRWE